jgi:hypothetical protein
MKNGTLVTLALSDLDTVSGGGQMLSPANAKSVLTVLGHDEGSIRAVQQQFGLSPGGVFANGANLGAQNSFKVLNAIKPWQ